jgi:hypothetical protein
MMKIIKRLILFILPVLLFSGCLKIQTTVTVNKDGSGKIDEKVLMSKAFVSMISQFAQSFGDSSETEQFSLFDEDKIKNSSSDYGEGVSYVSSEQISTEDWEGFRAVYSFSDLNKIRLEPDPDEKLDVGMNSENAEEDEEYYFFKFIGGDIPEVIIDRPEIEADLTSNDDEETDMEESGTEDDEMAEEFLKMMEGMSIQIAVEFAGEIVETNATYVEDSRLTLLEMNLSEMMKNKEEFKEFKNKEPDSIEEMKEFVEKFPGMKIEFQKPVRVKFK